MGLESLFAFTMLGGLAAGAYAFETVLRRARENERPWLVPLLVVILFAVGLVAAATHVHSFAHAFDSLFCGTVNFGSGMVHEVVVSGVFFVLALVDFVLSAMKKETPYAFRVATSIVAVVVVVLMGVAYIDILGNSVWCNAIATVLSFAGGALAMGIAFYVALVSGGYEDGSTRIASIVSNAILAVGIAFEASAFVEHGIDATPQIIALVVAPIASIVLVALSSKAKNARAIAVAVCVLSIVGVGISRWAFYATGAMM